MNSKGKIYFVLALHNHQPVGNFPEVFSQTFEQAYEPFITVLERHPSVKVVLHYSGPLLEWIEENQPSFIGRLQELVKREQVEMMGGAYYEPILPAIPDEDKIGQINLMNGRIEELFGTKPRGMWLAERVWEPHLARPIAEAGLEYITVDDAHFHDIGYRDLDHYYRTEESGYRLDIFPINEQLRYLIPFKSPSNTIEFFQEQLQPGKSRLFVLADDGEKFGGWPDTYQTVYERGWLEEIFGLLDDCSSWIELVTFSEFRELFPPRGPVYLPAGAYREMKEWSGGFWRNFLSRYPESNRMHKKMLAVRQRLQQLPAGEEYERARQLIWKSQCNCAYWHGVFGGLYLNFLRSAVWSSLIEAESIIDDSLQPPPYLKATATDRLYSGKQELEIRTDRLSMLLAPYLGGALLELSWRPVGVNLLDTLSRRPEAYHRKLFEEAETHPEPGGEAVSIHERQVVMEEGLQQYLQYDHYPRVALIEHILHQDTTFDDFNGGTFNEYGNLLLQQADTGWRVLPDGAEQAELPAEEVGGEGIMVTFNRTGALEEGVELGLKKMLTVHAGEDGFTVDYFLQNNSDRAVEFCFAVESSLAFLAGNHENCVYIIPGRKLDEDHLASTGSEEDVKQVIMQDCLRDLKLAINFQQPVTLWRAPIETVSQSEKGMERVYQQSLLLARLDLQLQPGKSTEFSMSFSFSRLRAEEGAAEEAGREIRV